MALANYCGICLKNCGFEKMTDPAILGPDSRIEVWIFLRDLW